MKSKQRFKEAQKPCWRNAILIAQALALSMSTAFWGDYDLAVGNDNWFVRSNWDPECPDPTTDAVINNGGTAQIGSKLRTADALSLTLGQNVGDSGTV